MQHGGILSWNPLQSDLVKSTTRLSQVMEGRRSQEKEQNCENAKSSLPTLLETLQPERPASTRSECDWVTLYENALKFYQQARFTEARDLTRALLKEHPYDKSFRFL